MVALVESALNESYVEPSPYAWLRSRTPVPTSYASACDPLYPFQDVLENRTSRARCMTGSCAEAPGRKCQICIEIWQFELESCVWRVSFHKYAYVHGDPIQGIDPTGMFLGAVIGIGAQLLLPGPADFIRSGIESLVKAYSSNLDWDVEWALDMSMPDSWGSRLDNDWVAAALMQGVHSAFRVEIPFTGIGVNPLDTFSEFSSSRIPTGGFSPLTGFSKFYRAGAFSFRKSFDYVADSGKRVVSTYIDYYHNVKFGSYLVVKFRKEDIYDQFSIVPNAPTRDGVAGLKGARAKDISVATQELEKRISRGEVSGVVVRSVNGRKKVYTSDGTTELTFHHDLKKGRMQLVSTELHEKSRGEGIWDHIGISYWWNRSKFS